MKEKNNKIIQNHKILCQEILKYQQTYFNNKPLISDKEYDYKLKVYY